MVRKIDWESQIGRRVKLRDLHVFGTVAQHGSMAQAAAELRVSQPAISEIISDLEHALDVRLFDRSHQGVVLTVYGQSLLKRTTVVFDELKQSIRDLEFLSDPTVGELLIGCPESIAASILPPIVQRFSQQYPRVVLQVKHVTSPPIRLPELRERKLDLILQRLSNPLAVEADDLNVELLFDDEMIIAAGVHTRWARRRKIDLAELVDEPWILMPPDSWNYRTLQSAFRARGLDMPSTCTVTFSVHLRLALLATGPFVTVFPKSFVSLNASRLALKVLPVDLPVRPWPVAIITLRNRILTPVTQLFIDQVRAFAKSVAADMKPGQNPG